MTSVFDYDVDTVLTRILESQAANDANYAKQECLTSEISNISEISSDFSINDIAPPSMGASEDDLDDRIGDVDYHEGYPELATSHYVTEFLWNNEDGEIEGDDEDSTD